MPNDDEIEDKKEKASAALDVDADASTRTIQANFRRKARALREGLSDVPKSKKSFEELNEAYQTLMQNRHKEQKLLTKHVAILSADVANYSGMMAANEAETIEFFNFCKEVFEEIVEKYQGRVFNTAGDSILSEFPYVLNAVDCAVEIQSELRTLNLGQPEAGRIQFRMGLNIGDVFIQGTDLLGDTVNIAARIQTAAKPGGICLSKPVHDLILNKTLHSLTSLGDKTFKNIPLPVRTYALTEGAAEVKPPLPKLHAEAEITKETERTKSRKKPEASGSAFPKVAVALVVAGAVSWAAWNGFLGGRPGHPALAPVAPSPQASVPAPAPSAAPAKPSPAAVAAALPGPGDSIPPPVQVDPELQREAESGDQYANYNKGEAYLKQGKFDEAFVFFRMAAMKDQMGAEYQLGMLYHSGQGTKKDLDASIYWLLHAARNGHKLATGFLAQHEGEYPDYVSYIRNRAKIDSNRLPAANGNLSEVERVALTELRKTLEDRGLSVVESSTY